MRVNRPRVLAIMAKAPRPGHVKTRLLENYDSQQVLSLYRSFVEDTLVTATHLPDAQVAVVCPAGDGEALREWLPDVHIAEQAGRGLADGLSSTFALFSEQGFSQIVALNSDTPHLPADALRHAFALLCTKDLVIGPTLDGGYYLVGASAAHPSLFDASALGTGAARAALVDRARELKLSVGLTEPCYDVDVREDLQRLKTELCANPERAPRTAMWLAQSGLD